MSIRRRWSLLLIPPVLALGFCIFLIGANYYYARRAEYLLQRVRGMTLNNSSIAELKGLGSEHGFRYEEASNCGPIPCIHMVATNNLWMQTLLIRASRAKIGDLLALKPWLAVGDIEIQDQQVVGKIYGLAFYEGRYDPAIQVTAWEELKFDLTPCAYHPR